MKIVLTIVLIICKVLLCKSFLKICSKSPNYGGKSSISKDDLSTEGFSKVWNKANTNIGNSLSLSYFDKNGFKTKGLTTKEFINKNEVFLRINPIDCLYSYTGSSKIIIVGLENYWGNFSDNTKLSLQLLLIWKDFNDGKNPKNTFFEGYLASLPEPYTLNTPIDWNENKIQQIPYEYMKRFLFS